MAAPDYSRRSFDLATARDRGAILDAGTLINGVTVVSVPAGAVAQLHFGANRDPIDLATGDQWDCSVVDANGCPKPMDEGLFMSNPAGAGSIVLIISFGPVGSGVRAV